MLLGTVTGVWNLAFMRWAMPYQEETRRQTYTRSMTYQQGSQANFEDLCLQWQQAKDQPSKDMIAGVIRQRRSVYVGPAFSDDVLSCFGRIGN